MDYKNIEVKRTGRVAVVRFDRGDRLNALSLELMRDLVQVARSFEEDHETSVVVLTGTPKAFSAGIDLRDPALQEALHAPLGRRRSLLSYGPRMCAVWEQMAPITIAAIEGHCVGGAVSLAVSCDFRIAAENAVLTVPELALGMNMSWQTLPRLVHLVGPAKTKRMVILGERVAANTALDWGLVEEVAREGDALERALAMAEKFAAIPPLPVRMTKQAVNVVTTALDHAASYMDTDQFMLCQMTEDHREGVSAFLEKRKPTFKGK